MSTSLDTPASRVLRLLAAAEGPLSGEAAAKRLKLSRTAVWKQIDVLRVTDVTRQRHISRELILVELATGKTGRAPIMELAALFSAQIVAVQASSLTLQYAGDEPQTADFLRTLRGFDVLDIARSGVIAVSRGNHDD